MKKINALIGQGFAQPEDTGVDISEGSIVSTEVDRNALTLPEVTIVGKEPVTTSQAIARYFGRDHDKVVNRIENLDCSAEFLTRNFRRVKFEHKGRSLNAYEVTKDGFTFLAMGFTGKKAAAFKENYIAQFNYMANWMAERLETKSEMRSMTDAMKGYIERTGDRQHGFAYSNECSFLNSLVLGMHPRVWAKQKEIPVKQVRDHMNSDQLALLAYLESRDCALLDLDTRTATRKTKLTELAQRWLVKRVGGTA
ncbi:Rha family transcriptional regulator [Klebsiella variicola]|uniref:Rha family transcriptional regulator n=1 Tax=Klebsiella variicola TaxID=244366 RepID=UPI0018AAF320|nr:Rha family transcriptional regulator [Klebsiella variicola]